MIQKWKKKPDYNTCNIFYMKDGFVSNIRAISHLSGVDAENKDEYVLTLVKLETMPTNTTNDSLLIYLKDAFKNYRIQPNTDFEYVLEIIKAGMNEDQKQTLEQILDSYEEWFEEKQFISKEAIAFETLKGKTFVFQQIRIPKQNYIRRVLDV